MTLLETVVKYNRSFVEENRFEQFLTDKLPTKRYVVISCMDSRLVELLPASMDIHNGDVILLKTGGGIVSHPFGSLMRSILVAVYELGAEEIFLIGHHDCGMGKLNPTLMQQKMMEKGITQETIDTINSSGFSLDGWLRGFDSVEESVKSGVKTIRNHPLLSNIPVHGLIMDPETGKLDVVDAGYPAPLAVVGN